MITSSVLKKVYLVIKVATLFGYLPWDVDSKTGHLSQTKNRHRILQNKLICHTVPAVYTFFLVSFVIDVYYNEIPAHMKIVNIIILVCSAILSALFLLINSVQNDCRILLNKFLETEVYLQQYVFTKEELLDAERNSRSVLIKLVICVESLAAMISISPGVFFILEEYNMLRRYVYRYFEMYLGLHSWHDKIGFILSDVLWYRFGLCPLIFMTYASFLFIESITFWLTQLAENEVLFTKPMYKVGNVYKILYTLNSHVQCTKAVQVSIILVCVNFFTVIPILNCAMIKLLNLGFILPSALFLGMSVVISGVIVLCVTRVGKFDDYSRKFVLNWNLKRGLNKRFKRFLIGCRPLTLASPFFEIQEATTFMLFYHALDKTVIFILI